MKQVLPSYSEIQHTLTLEQKVGQCVMPAVFLDDTEKDISRMEEQIKKGYIGSLCFFQSRQLAAANVQAAHSGDGDSHSKESYGQRLKKLIERYQRAAPIPLLIAIDGEWGLSMRLPDQPKYPYPISLGALAENSDLIRNTGQAIGRECREAGVHWNLAPVVDVNTNPDNPVIGYRAFGDDPEQVVQCARSWMEGLRLSGVLNCLKHFPGHGDTAFDSHLTLPVLNKSEPALQSEEWIPFRALHSLADSIMLGHLAVPQLTDGQPIPATLSAKIIQHLRQWGFEGALISDALNMKSVSMKYKQEGALEAAAFHAGCDILCFSDHPLQAIRLVGSTENPQRIDASFQRLWRLKTKAFASPAVSRGEPQSYSDLLTQLAKKSLTLFRGSPEDLQTLSGQKPRVQLLGTPLGQSFVSSIKQESDPNSKTLLVAVHLPSPKPGQLFGLQQEELDQLIDQIQHHAPWLYLFGNPYFLRHIPWESCAGIVLLYENTPIHEEIALQHYHGVFPAKGRLPIQLSK